MNQKEIAFQKRLEYLKEQIKFSGFDESLYLDLEKKMRIGKDEFQLNTQIQQGEKQVGYTLHFQKSKETDNYFYNSFDAKLMANEKVEISNKFYGNKRITAKEAFNLMEGRSVEKKYNHFEKVVQNGKESFKPIKNDTYLQWVKLDFNDADKNGALTMKTFGEKWGFELEKKLMELPIKNIDVLEDRQDLMTSLKRGNLQAVNFEKDGKTEQHFLAANPRARSVDVYDANMVKIEMKEDLNQKVNGNSKSASQGQSAKNNSNKQGSETTKANSQAKTTKTGVAADAAGTPKNGKTRSRKLSQSR